MNKFKKLIEALIKEIEQSDNILNVHGAKGYGTGKARVKDPHPVSKNLGHERGEEQEEYELKPVKISKAFKRRKNDK